MRKGADEVNAKRSQLAQLIAAQKGDNYYLQDCY